MVMFLLVLDHMQTYTKIQEKLELVAAEDYFE
jgi:hypothetical protein